MNKIQKFAIAYLVCLALLVYGFAIGKYEIFPYKYAEEFEEFLAWDWSTEEATVEDKLKNELGIKPNQFLWFFPPAAIENTTELPLANIQSRRENPRIFMAPEHRSGYRAIFGVMDFDDYFWGGVLISPDSRIIHSWKMSTSHLPLSTRPDHLKNMYGLALLPDGSVIFNMQVQGGGIVKVDACGNILWNLEGEFHHTVSMSEDNSYFWTFEGKAEAFHHKLAQVSSKTGEIIRILDMKDVYKKNEFTHIFNLQKKLEFKTKSDWMDISHGNDIDELGASQSHEYPGFKAGDLLLSYRNQNLIFILDTETLEVKWWRIGATDRQHDTDWERGAITAFSNNAVGARKGHSDIVHIDINSMEHDILVDGKKHSIFSLINARQQRTEFDTRLIISSKQGWALEVDDKDEVVFSFLNAYDSNEQMSLHLSEAYRVKPNYFISEFWESCRS